MTRTDLLGIAAQFSRGDRISATAGVSAVVPLPLGSATRGLSALENPSRPRSEESQRCGMRVLRPNRRDAFAMGLRFCAPTCSSLSMTAGGAWATMTRTDLGFSVNLEARRLSLEPRSRRAGPPAWPPLWISSRFRAREPHESWKQLICLELWRAGRFPFEAAFRPPLQCVLPRGK